jgi:hypothetical protein
VEKIFSSIEDVKKHFSGEFVTCLLCGKEYRAIGNHIVRIHNMSIDEFKVKYNIPWSYSLSSEVTRVKKRDIRLEYIETLPEGTMKALAKDARGKRSGKVRMCPFKSEVAIGNLNDYCIPKNYVEVDGKLISKTEYKRLKTSKFGSEEHRKKLRNRSLPQSKALGEWWKGKKQCDEHIEKRVKSAKKTREAKKITLLSIDASVEVKNG